MAKSLKNIALGTLVSRVIEVSDATAGTVTFALESRFKGTCLLIR